MFLRTNKVLKYFAIILFTFELVAPAFAAAISSEGFANSKATMSNGGSHQSPFVPILLEESNENEEEKAGHKTTLPSDCPLFERCHISFDIHGVDFSSYLHSLQQVNPFPALYQVHCKFLI